MKYIVYEVGVDEHVVVFPELLIHKWVARGLRYQDPHSSRAIMVKPISAGFCHFPDMAAAGETEQRPDIDRYMPACIVVCSGRSDSMQLDSRPQDAALIAKEYGFQPH